MAEAPLDPVLPDQLAWALTMSERHMPLGDPTADFDDQEEDAAFRRIEDELVDHFGDRGTAERVDARLRLLREFLQGDGGEFHSVDAQGLVDVDAALLDYAASGSLSDRFDEVIRWPMEGRSQPVD